MFDDTLIDRLLAENDPLKKMELSNQYLKECQEMDRIRIEDMMGEDGEVS